VIVLGLDISMTSTGWVLVEVLPNNALCLRECGVSMTEKNETGEVVSSTLDSLRRAAKLREDIEGHFFYERETSSGTRVEAAIDLVVVESMSWPRNAASAIKMAMAWGALCGLAKLPLIEVGPQAIKLELGGKKSATKREVEEGVKKRISLLSAETLEASIHPKSLREHCWDALGAILTAQKTQKYQLVRAGHLAASRQHDPRPLV